MKHIHVYALLLMSVFLTSCGQNKTGLSQVNIKSAPSAPIDSNYTQFRDHTEPGHHNVVHEFTYLVAMRDFCNKTLLQMRANGEVNKKLSKELERELLNANAELASSKFNGFKIELGLYEIFLKQINDKFRKERSC